MTLVQLLAAIVWTYLFQRLYRLLFPPRRMLLVCGDRPAFHLMEKINSREDKYYLAKAIHIRAGMEAIIREAGAFDALIIGDIPAKDRNALLKKCFEEDIRTYTVPKLSDILIRTSEELDIFDSPLLLSRNEGISGGQRFVKRAIDLFFSGLGIVVLSPFFLLVALSIYLTDRGPVFYKQTRLTEGGKEFQICKFLFNIWKGEMSIVGPRPERPELAAEIEEEIPEFCYRLKMKAGLTGYAQVYGKYNTTSYDKLKLDLTYIRNYSLLLDLKLMLMTPKIMMLKEITEGVADNGNASDSRNPGV